MHPIVSIASWSPAQASEVEVAAVVALIRSSMAAKRPPEVRSARRTREVLDHWLQTGRTGALVARGRGNEVHGVCIVRNEPPTARIIFLCAKYARQGCGTALARKVEELARRHRLVEIRAAINPADPVQAGFFIQNLGYAQGADVVTTIDGVAHVDCVLPVTGGSSSASGSGLESSLGANPNPEPAVGAVGAGPTPPGSPAVVAAPRIRVRVSPSEREGHDRGSDGGRAASAMSVADTALDGGLDQEFAAELAAAADRRSRGIGVALGSSPASMPAFAAAPGAAPAAAGSNAPASDEVAQTVVDAVTAPPARAVDDTEVEDEDEPSYTEQSMRRRTERLSVVAPPGAEPPSQDRSGSRRRLVRSEARAVVITDDSKRRIRLGDKDVFLVGRTPEVDIVIQGRKASRRHCELRWVADQLIVEDLGSSNGTFLNGNAVDRAELFEGDVLSIGRTRIGFDNLAVRSQSAEVAGRLPLTELESGDTVGAQRVRPLPARVMPPRAVDPANGRLVAELRRTIEEQGARLQALEGIVEAARASAETSKIAAAAIQLDLQAERARRIEVEDELAEERRRWAGLEQALVKALADGLPAGGAHLVESARDLAQARQRALEAIARFADGLDDLRQTLGGWEALESVLAATPGLRELVQRELRPTTGP